MKKKFTTDVWVMTTVEIMAETKDEATQLANLLVENCVEINLAPESDWDDDMKMSPIGTVMRTDNNFDDWDVGETSFANSKS